MSKNASCRQSQRELSSNMRRVEIALHRVLCLHAYCTLYSIQTSLWHINCKSVTHSGLYFATYFFFFAELAHGESDPCFAILLFPCNKHHIRRFITLRAQNMWGKTANRKRYKAASPDTFAETERKKCVVITLQARARYRKRPIRTGIDRY